MNNVFVVQVNLYAREISEFVYVYLSLSVYKRISLCKDTGED